MAQHTQYEVESNLNRAGPWCLLFIQAKTTRINCINIVSGNKKIPVIKLSVLEILNISLCPLLWLNAFRCEQTHAIHSNECDIFNELPLSFIHFNVKFLRFITIVSLIVFLFFFFIFFMFFIIIFFISHGIFALNTKGSRKSI